MLAAPNARPDRRPLLVATGLVLLAAALRLWSLDFGLPHPHVRPDEMTVVRAALNIPAEFTPGFFNYPSLYLDLLAPLYVVYYLVGKAAGWLADPHDLAALVWVDPSPLILIGRCSPPHG